MKRFDIFVIIPGTGSGPRLDPKLDAGRDATTCNPGSRDNTPAPCPVASKWDRGGAWHVLATLAAAGPRAQDGRVRQVGPNNGIISGNTFGL